MEALPSEAAHEVSEYLAKSLRATLDSRSVDILSGDTMLLLLQSGCRTKVDVEGLGVEAITALADEARSEVAEYLLRAALGPSSKDLVGAETFLPLLRADCRTQQQVLDLSAESISVLPAKAQQEVLAYQLRTSLGDFSKGMVSNDTLLSLLRFGCHTKDNVKALTDRQLSNSFTQDESNEIKTYKEREPRLAASAKRMAEFRKKWGDGRTKLFYDPDSALRDGDAEAPGQRLLVKGARETPTEVYHATSIDAALS
eukprot:COSAG04_NODE_9502_length_858_cov_1.054018_1_plen_255_part_10